jgi:anti-sigma factor RsiW
MTHISEDQLMAISDGEGTPAELATIQSHLEGCPECRGKLEALRRLSFSIRQFGSSGSVGVPARDFTASVMARVSSAPANSSYTPWRAWFKEFMMPSAAVFAGAFLLMISVPEEGRTATDDSLFGEETIISDNLFDGFGGSADTSGL